MVSNQPNIKSNAAAFRGLLDYAGLFPPSGLPMDQAVANVLDYQICADHEILNTFVLPASRLQEFVAAIDLQQTETNAKLKLSVLSSAWETDVKSILDFRSEHSEIATIVSVETRQPTEAAAIRKEVDQVYVEVPPGPDVNDTIQSLQDQGAYAKIRMGGLTPDAFPSCESVAAFVIACCRHKVAFKATAGLHHALRASRQVKSNEETFTTKMHGFVNVIAAVVRASEGESVAEVAKVLGAENADALFPNNEVDSISLANTREHFHSIGSCSFTKPIEDLRQLGWL